MTDRGFEGSRIPGFKGNSLAGKGVILDPFGAPAEAEYLREKLNPW
jgi:hypothetical protein